MKKRKRMTAIWLLLLLSTMLLLPMTAYAAEPKEGDYVDLLEHYPFFSSTTGYYIDRIYNEELVPVELVLQPVEIKSRYIDEAHDNSGDPDESWRYGILENEPTWTVKVNGKSEPYTLHHSVANSGSAMDDGTVFTSGPYTYSWSSDTVITFSDFYLSVSPASYGNDWVGDGDVTGSVSYRYDYNNNGQASRRENGQRNIVKRNVNAENYARDTRLDYCSHEQGSEYGSNGQPNDYYFTFIASGGGAGGSYEGYESFGSAPRQSYSGSVESDRGEIDIEVVFRVVEVKLGKGLAGAPIHEETITHAGDDPGESAVGVSDDIVNGNDDEEGSPAAKAAVAVVITGTAAMAGAGAKNNGDDPKKKKRYEMRIRKEFGDTLSVGKRMPIYARIVEISPEGAETSRDDLSAQISIRSPEYLQISGEGMAGVYKAAYVEAPRANPIPAEATVDFKFSGEGGTFTNHVIFKVQESKVLFGQENLTLPACYDKTERLPFAVLGLGDDVSVTAAIAKADGYRVAVEPGEEPGLYYAVITETKKTEGDAGDYEHYSLVVTAAAKEQTVTGELPIYRFNMGLRVDLQSIGCYAVEFDPSKHNSKFRYRSGDKWFVPAEARATLTLFHWDAESHSILRVAPSDLGLSIQAEKDSDQPTLEKLGLQCQVMDEKLDGGRAMVFRCCKCALDAPTRFKTKVRFTANFNNEAFRVESEVLLRSQPYRAVGGLEGIKTSGAADAKIRDNLLRIQSQIWEKNYVNNLFPLLSFIDVLIKGYDSAYGYDEKQVKVAINTWVGFLNGSVVGANATPEQVTLADEMQLYIDSYLQTAESVEKSLGFMGRMALGVATLGCSDMVFTSLEVVRGMKDYVEQGGDSAWGAFYVGAKIVTLDYIADKGMELGLSAVKAKLPAIKKSVSEGTDKVKQFYTSTTGQKAKTAIAGASRAQKAAIGKAESIIESGKRLAAKAADDMELDEALYTSKQFSMETVENLQAAAWQYKLSPTAANRKLLNDITLQIQQNKLAMYALRDSTDESINSARKAFNETMAGFYSKTDDMAKQKLAELAGIPADKIKILNASSSSQQLMREGKKITMDRDWTAYYEGPDGSRVYFDQTKAQEIYNDCFYESSLGFESRDGAFSTRYAKKMDQTVIEDVLDHKESYGADLDKMLDKSKHSLALDNAEKVARTVAEKGKERFREYERLLAEAKSIPDAVERQLTLGQAQGEAMEGFRQLVKQFDNCVNPRDTVRWASSGSGKIAENLRVAVEMCRKQLDFNRDITVSALMKRLKEVGFTPDSLADTMGDTIKLIG